MRRAHAGPPMPRGATMPDTLALTTAQTHTPHPAHPHPLPPSLHPAQAPLPRPTLPQAPQPGHLATPLLPLAQTGTAPAASHVTCASSGPMPDTRPQIIARNRARHAAHRHPLLPSLQHAQAPRPKPTLPQALQPGNFAIPALSLVQTGTATPTHQAAFAAWGSMPDTLPQIIARNHARLSIAIPSVRSAHPNVPQASPRPAQASRPLAPLPDAPQARDFASPTSRLTKGDAPPPHRPASAAWCHHA